MEIEREEEAVNGQTEISLPSPAIRFSFVGHKRRFYHSCLEVDGLGSPASSGSDKVSERTELTAEGGREGGMINGDCPASYLALYRKALSSPAACKVNLAVGAFNPGGKRINGKI